MTCWIQIALLGLTLTVSTAGEGVTTTFLAKQESKEAQSLTAPLRVKNDAPGAVNLMSCIENSKPVTVDPGGTISLALFGTSGMWVVPDGATLDCEKGPFPFFYIATDFEDPKDGLGAFVGFGVEMDADEQNSKSSNSSNKSVDYAALLEAEEQPLDLHGVTGLEVSAGKDDISCTTNFCEADFPVTAASTGLDLVIKGTTTTEAPAYVSLWGWRGRGWGGRGWGGRGWGGRGWGGRRWGRRGGWGWGRRRWGFGGRRWWR